MMRTIPVLDVKGGRAVHARGGDRAHYLPVRSVLHEGSDPRDLTRAFRDRLGLREVYVADLDAIEGGAVDRGLIRSIADSDLDVLIDAGLRDVGDAVAPLEAGAASVVAGLETLRGPDAIASMVDRFGAERVVFGLDLKGGRPMVPTLAPWGTDDPLALAGIAVGSGVRRVIVLDLDRVGAGAGVGTLPLIAALRAAHPEVDLIAGGGIAGPEDLRAIERAGASAALVGSALHDGRLP